MSEASSEETGLFVSDETSLEFIVLLRDEPFAGFFPAGPRESVRAGKLLPMILSKQAVNNSFRGLSERSEFRRNEFVCKRRGELRIHRAFAGRNFRGA